MGTIAAMLAFVALAAAATHVLVRRTSTYRLGPEGVWFEALFRKRCIRFEEIAHVEIVSLFDEIFSWSPETFRRRDWVHRVFHRHAVWMWRKDGALISLSPDDPVTFVRELERLLPTAIQGDAARTPLNPPPPSFPPHMSSELRSATRAEKRDPARD